MNRDCWVSVARHLNVRALCRMMQVSHSFLVLWRSDPIWQHQKDCFNEFNYLFEMHKKHGIWFVFARILSVGFTCSGFYDHQPNH